jgi:HEAT repeat protein
LGCIGPVTEEVVPALIAFVESGSWENYSGMDALAQIGPAAAVATPSLMEVLGDKKRYAHERASAAHALGRIGAAGRSEVAMALAAALDDADPDDPDDEYFGLSDSIADALREGGGTAAAALETALKSGSESHDPHAIINALQKVGAAAVPVLVRLLDHADAAIRGAAALALGEIGPEAKAAASRLQSCLRDSDNDVRYASAVALADIDPNDTCAILPVLIEALTNGDKYDRCDACYALRRLGAAAADAIPKLKIAREDPDDDVREAAIEALAKIAASQAPAQAL